MAASIVPILAAVAEQNKKKVINDTLQKEAISEITAIKLEDPYIQSLLSQYKHMLSFIHSKDEKYWIDSDEYAEYMRKKSIILMIIVILILVILVILF